MIRVYSYNHIIYRYSCMQSKCKSMQGYYLISFLPKRIRLMFIVTRNFAICYTCVMISSLERKRKTIESDSGLSTIHIIGIVVSVLGAICTCIGGLTCWKKKRDQSGGKRNLFTFYYLHWT